MVGRARVFGQGRWSWRALLIPGLLMVSAGWGSEIPGPPSPAAATTSTRTRLAGLRRGPAGIRYSPLDADHAANVPARGRLDATTRGRRAASRPTRSSSPRLYTHDARAHVVALDAATGALLWTFDSGHREQRPQPRRRLLGERRRPAHVHRRGPFRLRARCAHREAGRRLRRGGRIDLREDLGPSRRGAVDPAHHARRRLQGPADHRRPRQRGPAGLARRHPRLRRAHRRAALDVPHDSASRRDGLRDLAAGRLDGTAAAPTTGPAWRVDEARGIVFVPTGSAARRLLRRQSRTATTCSPTRCWRSTPRPASGSGTSRPCITTSGTATSRRRRPW